MNDSILTKLKAHGRAYAQLAQGADTLIPDVYWTERLLLRLLRHICTDRLRELVMILPDDEVDEVLLDVFGGDENGR
ncbi:MAG: hypothetical protein H6658_02265 [Ardenticatenaceae bacterium]|nr:hypothetical protein [Ardenticatenaceae bacterium]